MTAKTTKDWMKHHVKIDAKDLKGWFLHLEGKAVLPIPAKEAFRILAHPDGALVFRGVDECKHRKILENDGQGKLKVSVENISMWKVMMITGRVATRLVGEQDEKEGVIHMNLAPEPPKSPDARPTPAEKMELKWTIKPLSQCVDQAKAHKVMPIVPSGTNIDEEYCFVVAEQSQSPKGINMLVANALKGFAKTLLSQSFEDLVQEALNVWRGKPTLPPYEDSELKEINPNDEHAQGPIKARMSMSKTLAKTFSKMLSRVTGR